MIQINIGDHVSSQAGYIAFPQNRLAMMQWARRKAIWIAANIATANSFRIGTWTVLATLVHELAHVDGVRGAVLPQAAEGAVLACGLGRQSERSTGVDHPRTPYNPNIRG